jgi:hypothetical protein
MGREQIMHKKEGRKRRKASERKWADGSEWWVMGVQLSGHVSGPHRVGSAALLQALRRDVCHRCFDKLLGEGAPSKAEQVVCDHLVKVNGRWYRCRRDLQVRAHEDEERLQQGLGVSDMAKQQCNW